MFFADNLLTDKKSPLGIAWLAATLGPKNAHRRVNKKDISRYDLVNACEYISEPPEPLALRTSGILLYGVARVYNQHYEEFQHHVTRFHSDVQRAIQTNFATTVNGRIAGNQGIDLVDEGKSKLDAITFAGIDFGWQSGIDYEMRFINWNDPLNERSRRESSKLDSQLSQTTLDEEEEGSEGEDEDQEQEGGRVGRKHKLSSPYGLEPKRRSPHLSDRRSHDLLDEPVFGDMELFNLDELEGLAPGGVEGEPGDGELGLGADPNSSFSNPEPMGEMGDVSMDMDGDNALFMLDPLQPDSPAREGQVNRDDKHKTRMPESARKRGKDSGEMSEVEDLVEKKKKRVKKVKSAVMDKGGIELPEESMSEARRRYRQDMQDQRAAEKGKKGEKEGDEAAVRMVDAAGGWLGTMDPELADLFGGITKVDKFKWELDLAAHKLGTAYLPEDEEEEDGERGEKERSTRPKRSARVGEGGEMNMDAMGVNEHGNGMGMGRMDDPFMDYTNNDTTGYQDVNMDFMEPLHDPSSRPVRDDSADVEAVRRASQSGRISLPWESKSDYGYDDLAPGADSSFDTGSLHLTNMTPQEARLRLSSKSLKSGSLDALVRCARSRSGSVLDGKASRTAQMLFGEDGDEDESLPQDIRDMADQPSQYLQLPDAYRPEMMATLDMQCRLFLQFVEKRMVTEQTHDVEFEDICPPEKTKKSVACQAFYNVLTLTTKKILKVEQPEAFDSFSIEFTAQLKI